jgi:hypothetical protein
MPRKAGDGVAHNLLQVVVFVAVERTTIASHIAWHINGLNQIGKVQVYRRIIGVNITKQRIGIAPHVAVVPIP